MLKVDGDKARYSLLYKRIDSGVVNVVEIDPVYDKKEDNKDKSIRQGHRLELPVEEPSCEVTCYGYDLKSKEERDHVAGCVPLLNIAVYKDYKAYGCIYGDKCDKDAVHGAVCLRKPSRTSVLLEDDLLVESICLAR